MGKRIMLPSSSSLFHFTRKISVFKKIIKNGLMYFESPEYYPNDNIQTNKVYQNNVTYIIPMICFCDIPISRTLVHRKTYGNFSIGFNKEFLRAKLLNNLNPVNYVSSPDLASKLSIFRRRLDLLIHRNSLIFSPSIDVDNIIEQEFELIYSLYGYFKPYEYYDEREWRAVLPRSKKWGTKIISLNEKKDITSEHIKSIKSMTKGTNIYLSFSSEELVNAISHIIVPKESDINNFVKYILAETNPILGCNDVPEKERIMLVSKITSFERIEKDY